MPSSTQFINQVFNNLNFYSRHTRKKQEQKITNRLSSLYTLMPTTNNSLRLNKLINDAAISLQVLSIYKVKRIKNTNKNGRMFYGEQQQDDDQYIRSESKQQQNDDNNNNEDKYLMKQIYKNFIFNVNNNNKDKYNNNIKSIKTQRNYSNHYYNNSNNYQKQQKSYEQLNSVNSIMSSYSRQNSKQRAKSQYLYDKVKQNDGKKRKSKGGKGKVNGNIIDINVNGYGNRNEKSQNNKKSNKVMSKSKSKNKGKKMKKSVKLNKQADNQLKYLSKEYEQQNTYFSIKQPVLHQQSQTHPQNLQKKRSYLQQLALMINYQSQISQKQQSQQQSQKIPTPHNNTQTTKNKNNNGQNNQNNLQHTHHNIQIIPKQKKPKIKSLLSGLDNQNFNVYESIKISEKEDGLMNGNINDHKLNKLKKIKNFNHFLQQKLINNEENQRNHREKIQNYENDQSQYVKSYQNQEEFYQKQIKIKKEENLNQKQINKQKEIKKQKIQSKIKKNNIIVSEQGQQSIKQNQQFFIVDDDNIHKNKQRNMKIIKKQSKNLIQLQYNRSQSEKIYKNVIDIQEQQQNYDNYDRNFKNNNNEQIVHINAQQPSPLKSDHEQQHEQQQIIYVKKHNPIIVYINKLQPQYYSQIKQKHFSQIDILLDEHPLQKTRQRSPIFPPKNYQNQNNPDHDIQIQQQPPRESFLQHSHKNNTLIKQFKNSSPQAKKSSFKKIIMQNRQLNPRLVTSTILNQQNNGVLGKNSLTNNLVRNQINKDKNGGISGVFCQNMGQYMQKQGNIYEKIVQKQQKQQQENKRNFKKVINQVKIFKKQQAKQRVFMDFNRSLEKNKKISISIKKEKVSILKSKQENKKKLEAFFSAN